MESNRTEGEIEEEGSKAGIEEVASPNPNTNLNPNPRSVTTKVPEVEIHLYRSGIGPIEVFRSGLGGWDQDRIEVQDILEKYGFKSLFAFNAESGRGGPIRFSARNGRSLIPYRDGSVIYIDGEPKDPLVKPITKIIIGVVVLTLLIAIFAKEAPQWLTSKIANTFPPWVIACMVIAFTRLRKRTKNVFKKFGW